jgi:dimethylaniline monooxygenase (N-oxide forming)
MPPLPPGSKIAIIGGGTVGIIAARQCLDYGFVPTVFEKTSSVGGIWRQDPPGPSQHSPAYDSLYTNSSNTMMNISDFPFPFKTAGGFPTRDEICRYYEAYCEKFGLQKYIQFQSDVQHVEPAEYDESGTATRWKVTVSDS